MQDIGVISEVAHLEEYRIETAKTVEALLEAAVATGQPTQSQEDDQAGCQTLANEIVKATPHQDAAAEQRRDDKDGIGENEKPGYGCLAADQGKERRHLRRQLVCGEPCEVDGDAESNEGRPQTSRPSVAASPIFSACSTASSRSSGGRLEGAP